MRVERFCCCWDTRTGCIVVGYITGGVSVACCLGSVMRLMMGLPIVLQNDDYQGQFPFNPLFFVFSAIYFAFHTIASFSLVPAVQEARQMFFIPNLVMLFVDIVLDSTGIIVICTYLGNPNPYEDFHMAGLIIGCIILPALIYFSIIILSHFEEVFKKSDKEPLQKSKGLPCLPSSDITDTSESGSGTMV